MSDIIVALGPFAVGWIVGGAVISLVAAIRRRR